MSYDVKTVDGVDFIYIGNDTNGNSKYAVNYRYFLNDAEMELAFNERRSIALFRAKQAFFDREIKSYPEPFFVIRPCGCFAETVRSIKRAKENG